ncbi:MAG TPA: phosphoesterase, partial [Gemmataceae bacterium]|nr:phosphoesterase [Gemmataceae bacterium]
MSDKSSERVLVIPTSVFHAAGIFQGLSRQIEHYLPRILNSSHLSYLARAQAESDPTHKQIVPYVVLRWRDQVFHYTRG